MAAIREVQYPQQRHLVVAYGTLPTDRVIAPAPAELRFALGVAAAVDGIPLDDGDDTPQYDERMGEAFRAQQREIVG